MDLLLLTGDLSLWDVRDLSLEYRGRLLLDLLLFGSRTQVLLPVGDLLLLLVLEDVLDSDLDLRLLECPWYGELLLDLRLLTRFLLLLLLLLIRGSFLGRIGELEDLQGYFLDTSSPS